MTLINHVVVVINGKMATLEISSCFDVSNLKVIWEKLIPFGLLMMNSLCLTH